MDPTIVREALGERRLSVLRSMSNGENRGFATLEMKSFAELLIARLDDDP